MGRGSPLPTENLFDEIFLPGAFEFEQVRMIRMGGQRIVLIESDAGVIGDRNVQNMNKLLGDHVKYEGELGCAATECGLSPSNTKVCFSLKTCTQNVLTLSMTAELGSLGTKKTSVAGS